MRYDLVDRFYPSEPDPAFRRRAAWVLGQVEMHLAHSPTGNRLLDVGCGQGFYVPMLAALGIRTTGVESDQTPLAAARKCAKANGAEIVDARAEALPFPSAAFDIVLMSEVLEHLPRSALALIEAARVLRPGGLLLVTVPHAAYPLLWDPVNWCRERLGLKPVREGIFAGIWANHLRLYSPDALTREITLAGFVPRAPVFQTRHALPFLHNIVYGFGRAALERGILPRRWLPVGLRGADLTAPAPSASGKTHGPLAALIALIRFIDKRNPDALVGPCSCVNLCIAATRGHEGGA